MLQEDIQKNITQWMNTPFNTETQNEIKKLVDNNDEKEIIDRFYKKLEFGTGGMRGVMAAGTNRMNIYTIAAASKGLANYINANYDEKETKAIAVSYDSRNNSELFAKISASVFASNNIKTYIFPSLRPVPLLAYAVRHLKCISGVMVTASHNPPEYNGYKVFGADGGQVVSPHDSGIIAEVNKVKIGEVDYGDFDELLAQNKIITISDEIDEAFNNEVLDSITNKEIIKKETENVKIVYTPIHGSGNIPVRKALKSAGFKNILIVKEQEMPDGNFPTVKKPNPEEAPALDMAVKLAVKENADLVLATDPDADRVGIAVRNLNNDFILLNGNQTGAILVDYVIKALKEKSKLPDNAAVVSTIVTTSLIKAISEKNDVAFFETLTGFKHIGTKIREFEENEKKNKQSYKFIAGGEESYGYLIRDFVRDKDAVTAVCVLAEICAYVKSNNSTIYKYLLDIYRKYGCYKESLVSKELYGKDGMEQMAKIMEHFRSDSAAEVLNKMEIIKVLDYKNQNQKDLISGKTELLEGFPVSNVLQFYMSDGSRISLRPSGTEPKIKFYFSVFSPVNGTEKDNEIETKITNLDDKISEFEKLLNQEVETII